MSLEFEWQKLILEPPKVLGVDAFGDNTAYAGLTLTIKAMM
ncbi:MAG: hypothetical protein WBB28_20290 [Crinalium sp.]